MKPGQYDAVSTKVRAMWGKRVTSEEYRRLCSARNLPEMVSHLRGHPGWGEAFSAVNTNDINRLNIELCLRQHAVAKHIKLFHYLSRSDKALLRFPVLQMELNQIMRFMCLAAAGRAHEYNFTMPSYFDRYSKIKYTPLSGAVTYDDMLSAVHEADFYPILAALRNQGGGFPDYSAVEVAMRSYYYKTVFRIIDEYPDAGVAGRFREAVGIQIDLANICAVYRIKKYFPELDSLIAGFLIPGGAKLTVARLKRLYTASDAEDVKKQLSDTYYGAYFQEADYAYIESYCSEFLFKYHQRRIAMDPPSVFVPFVYLFLDDIELQNLIHIGEGLWYGLSVDQSKRYLIGV